ncbi:MAG: hypothetical protein AB7F86_00855 [Bdellovibrionales bacterium]
MKPTLKRGRNIALAILFLSLITAEFQACTNKFKTQGPGRTQNNGDFYTGKTESYAFSKANEPCKEIGRLGRPFPNRSIQYSAEDRSAVLVRENCTDIEPATIPPDQIQVSADGASIVFQTQSFNVQKDPGEFDVVPKTCPTGMILSGLEPANQMASPNVFTAPFWQSHEGIVPSLFGSLQALSRYQIRRLNSPLEFWRGLYQTQSLSGSTDYAVSFLVSRGNTNAATINLQGPTSNYQVTTLLDFDTGLMIVPWVIGYNSVSTSAVPYGSGYVVTIFFNSAGAAGIHGFSVSSARLVAGLRDEFGQPGDFVYVASASLHPIASYCQ